MGKKPFDPKSTVFTNAMLDIIMPNVSPNAWKILCLAMRKTAGWADLSSESGRKESDVISVSQFMKGCGIDSDHTVKRAIEECLDRNFLLRQPDGHSFRYSLNVDYELPNIADFANLEHRTFCDVNIADSAHTNSKQLTVIKDSREQKTQQSTLAKELGDQMNKAEYMVAVKNSLDKSLSSGQLDYAQYPERIRPVVERMEKYWHFKAPQPKKKGGQFAFWIESCDEVLEACAEFGLIVLDKLHDDWEVYMDENGGCAPFTVSSPKSLVNAVLAKSAQIRSGKEKVSLWRTAKKETVRQSMLDV